MNIDLDELRRHRDWIHTIAEQVPWCPPDEEGCQITYLRIPKVSLEDGLQEGIVELYSRQKRKAKEQPKLRKGTKYYIRLVRRDGKLLRADKVHDGEVNMIYLAHYTDNTRYLVPFWDIDKPSWHYTYVTHWENGQVKEEYAQSQGQILRWVYTYLPDGSIEVSYVNAVPDGNEPILCWETAIFTPGQEITCRETGQWDFWMKDKQ